MYNLLCTMYNLVFTIYYAQFIIYHLQCTMYNLVLFTIFNLPYTFTYDNPAGASHGYNV